MTKQKPELLAPTGNIESFYAALNAGADAIFLGLQEFNARGRANNCNRQMLRLALKKAKEKNIKVYVTLNVLIKNREIDFLLEILVFLDAVKVDGIIIQDWGVYYLAHKYFPNIRLHASTQMAVHNSVGVNYNAEKGITRTVLARELTMQELGSIARKAKTELEVFIHGALCYSFSGMCLFSSYAGGQGANRGLCKQSCRRVYQHNGKQHTLFSLKDNQQIRNLAKLFEMGIRSLKIEGRMKSADYVYQVCKAYRMALDNPQNMEYASQMLSMDMGREKTSWFLGENISESITEDSSTGICIGKVKQVQKGTLRFISSLPLEAGYRLRIRNTSDNEQLYIKLDGFSNKNGVYEIKTDLWPKIQQDDDILLVRLKSQSFPSRLGNANNLPELKIPPINKFLIKKDLISISGLNQKSMLFVRIGSPAWLPKLRFNDYDAVILSYKRFDLRSFNCELEIYKINKNKIWFEFPKFISEKHINFYKDIATRLVTEGFTQFFISHLSQKLILPKNVKVSCNENVYILNDASAQLLRTEQIQNFIYPLEGDLDNLLSMNNKQGIVPLYFYPELFYSRMPVGIAKNDLFVDENKKKCRKTVKDGVTIFYPSIPVALFHYKKQLEKNGFNRFLIDYSGETLTANVVKRVLRKFIDGEAIQPSTNFNFKLGLK